MQRCPSSWVPIHVMYISTIRQQLETTPSSTCSSVNVFTTPMQHNLSVPARLRQWVVSFLSNPLCLPSSVYLEIRGCPEVAPARHCEDIICRLWCFTSSLAVCPDFAALYIAIDVGSLLDLPNPNLAATSSPYFLIRSMTRFKQTFRFQHSKMSHPTLKPSGCDQFCICYCWTNHEQTIEWR